MSYDLQVWSVEPLREGAFRQPQMWEAGSHGWTHGRKNWQIVVSKSDRVVPEDVPDEISKLLPGIEWLTNLNLEGNASAEALRLAHSAANDCARTSHGAVLDPQDGSIRLPSGVKRFMSPRRKETFDIVSMSWWFLQSPIENREGRAALLSLFERMLPEALPKRYGLYEPPQHVYAQTGKEHLMQFMDENLHDLMIWYPHRPVVDVHLGMPAPLGAHRLGFRTNHLSIDVERSALAEPGWATSLKRFWSQASVLIRPIYGDVRILGGYQWMGATTSGGEQHPVRAWFWAGVPEKLGYAVVLGDVYQKLWPTFAAAGTVVDGLAFASLEDWTTNGDLVARVGNPPQEQVRLPDRFPVVMNAEEFRDYMAEVRRVGEENLRRKYPPAWPFGEPFSS